VKVTAADGDAPERFGANDQRDGAKKSGAAFAYIKREYVFDVDQNSQHSRIRIELTQSVPNGLVEHTRSRSFGGIRRQRTSRRPH